MCGVGHSPKWSRPARHGSCSPQLGVLGRRMEKTTPVGPGLGRRSAALYILLQLCPHSSVPDPQTDMGRSSPMSLGHQWVVSEPKAQTSRSGGISPGIKTSAQFCSFTEEDALLYSSWSVSVPGRGHSLSFFLLATLFRWLTIDT